ncbi:MAG: glycosyltransferase [Planctomycetes bacterium]|nr:glycosyltransferase [Planctomycetota bacterium]
MGLLRIEGEPSRDLAREPYDLTRRHLLEPKAVCHAPFGALHLGERLRPCRHGAADLGDPQQLSLAQAFGGEAADRLRDRFRRYLVRRDECARCIGDWEDGAPAESPALHEYDHALPPVNGVPPRLHALSIDASVALPEARLAEVRALLPQLDHVTLLCATLERGGPAARLLGELDALRDGGKPELRLIARSFVPAPADVPPGVRAVEIDLPLVPAPLDRVDEERLADLSDDLRERKATLVVQCELGRSNWSALRGWLARCGACGAATAPALLPRGDADSLAALDADLLSTLHAILFRWSVESGLAAEERHGAPAQRALLARLREWQSGARPTTADASATLAAPDFTDEGEALRLLQDLLRAYHHPQVEQWLLALTQAPGFVAAARERLSLRLATLWLAAVFERSELATPLRAIYRDARHAAEQVAADRLALAQSPLAGWHDGWVATLRLETQPRGAPPFAPAAPAARAPGRAQLTVIIPSFNHEKFIGQAIDSALSQVGAGVRVVVVDDGSTDRTFEVARERRDPRLVVRRNSRNLGLGESLLRAVRRVRTPYVAVLNSDDFFHPERIAKLLAALKRSPRAAVAASLVAPVDADGRALTLADASPIFDGKRIHDWLSWWEKAGAPPADGDLLGPLFERNWLVTSSNLVCRRDFLLRHAKLWRDLEYCVDWQLFLAAAAAGKLRVVREPLLGYRLHGSNTVWFDAERGWRFYVESHRVLARALEQRLRSDRSTPRRRFDGQLELIAKHVAANQDVDWAGIWLGQMLERLDLPSRALRRGKSRPLIEALDRMRQLRLEARDVAGAVGGQLSWFHRMRGEEPWLRAERNRAEAFASELSRLRGELQGAQHDRRNLEKLWRQAERERDAEIAGKVELYQRLDALNGDVEAARREVELHVKALSLREGELADKTSELEQLRAMRHELQASLDALQREHDHVRADIEHAIAGLGGRHDIARGDLAHALSSMQSGHDFVRGELSHVLARVQEERARVEAGFEGTLAQAHRERDATLLAAAREREMWGSTLDRLNERLAAVQEDCDRVHRQLGEERARSEAATVRAEQAARATAAALARAREEQAQAVARERAAAEDRLAAQQAAAAAERAALEQQAQQERQELERQWRQAAGQLRVAEIAERLAKLEEELARQKALADQRTAERDRLLRTPEYRLGHLALNKLPLKKPLRFLEKKASKAKSVWTGKRLSWERKGEKPRVFATICWNFPIYSQTFVYQELTQLEKRGFDLRVVYSKLDPKDRLHAQFGKLWDLKRPMHLDRPVHEADYKLFKARFPDRVERLVQRLCTASGMAREQLEQHDNFLQGFTYARLAQAGRADYLHSYFFYDRSLMSLIAGEVLDLPHGVSCYADHVLKDYELKVVPLHLETCDVVVATSHRIKRELLALAPGTPESRILVKPNAIDCTRFPVIPRPEPAAGQPHRLVVTSRIEPKKGLIYLVEAVKLLRDSGLDVEAHFVGDADHGVPASENCKAELCARIEALGLWGKVHLEGRQPEQKVRHFLSIAHLFVAPFVETASGDKDGIPTALIEAMATGIPSVVTDAGSILEVVDDRVDARVVPQRDPQALATAIRELLQDPRGRKLMANKAAQKAREKFDVSICEPWFHERVRAALAARRKS